MGADLALAGNAHRMRELAELLLQGPRTMAELAGDLGVSLNDAEHVLARLRMNSLPVAIVEDSGSEPLYRILSPKGRVCAAQGCATLLRRSNPQTCARCTEAAFCSSTPSHARPGPSRRRVHIGVRNLGRQRPREERRGRLRTLSRGRRPFRGSTRPPCAEGVSDAASVCASSPPWLA